MNGQTIQGFEGISFHYFSASALRRLRENETWKNLAIRTGDPGVDTVAECVIPPKFRAKGAISRGVYDNANNLVAASRRTKGSTGDYHDRVPEHRRFTDVLRSDRTACYLGWITAHYGHFLLETLCRAWACWDLDQEVEPVIQGKLPSYGSAFYALIPGVAGRIRTIEAPERFREVIVPEPAFTIDSYAYASFKKMCVDMAGRALPSPLRPTEQPLYLSRSGLRQSAKRTIVGEKRLERLLVAEGFRVVHPETLSIADQIALFNTHRWIVSPMGSACHTRLFARDSTTILMLATQTPNANYALCDMLCTGSAHYVNALSSPKIEGNKDIKPFRKPLMLDDEPVLATLKGLGLIRPGAAFDGAQPGIERYMKEWRRVARHRGVRKLSAA